MKLVALKLTLVVLLFSGISQAQDIPPPPPNKTEVPSLEVTMKFIEDKLNLTGRLSYLTYNKDNVSGGDGTNSFSQEITSVRATPADCQVSFHYARNPHGQNEQSGDYWFKLKQVQEIEVIPVEQELKEEMMRSGHPELSFRADPEVFVDVVHGGGSDTWSFYFVKEETAKRVAAALNHAVEVCGGGSKDPF